MDIKTLYTRQTDSYVSFSNRFHYVEGLRTFFSSSGILRPDMRVLDAGCGTGFLTLAFIRALKLQNMDFESIHGFDLTPAMLERFKKIIDQKQLKNIELCEANVFTMDDNLPESWQNYNLIMCASMLEYIPRDKLIHVINSLCRRLAPNGTLLLIVTRRNLITKYLIDRKWNAKSFKREEIRKILKKRDMEPLTFHHFPFSHFWLNIWGYIVSASSIV